MDLSKLTVEQECQIAYAAVSQAITQWARVEADLCDVFTSCISLAYTLKGGFFDGSFHAPGGPAVAFYAVDNFRSKLSITDKMVWQHVRGVEQADEIGSRWAKAHDHARRLSARRNEVAHWELTIFEKRNPGQRARLVPAFRSQAYHNGYANRQFGVAFVDLHRLSNAFVALSSQLRKISRDIADDEELRSRFVGQVSALIHNLGLSDPSAVERVKRDLSWPETPSS